MDEMRRLNREFDIRPVRKILKLPCNCTSVEILRPEDTYIVCPVCFKKYLLTYSKIGKHKIEGEL